MKVLFIISLLFFAEGAWANSWVLSEADWAQPRGGEALLQDPDLSSAVNALIRNAGSGLEIHYPGGDDGLLWASELQGWLVALGIASNRIELVPGSSEDHHIELRVSRHPIGAGTYN